MFRFNKSVRVEVRSDTRLTGDSRVLLCRDVLSASGVDRWMSRRIDDRRDRAADSPYCGGVGADGVPASGAVPKGSRRRDGVARRSGVSVGDSGRARLARLPVVGAERGPSAEADGGGRGQSAGPCTAGSRAAARTAGAGEGVPSAGGVIGGDGRHAGRSVAGRTGAHGGGRHGVRAGGAGPGPTTTASGWRSTPQGAASIVLGQGYGGLRFSHRSDRFDVEGGSPRRPSLCPRKCQAMRILRCKLAFVVLSAASDLLTTDTPS